MTILIWWSIRTEPNRTVHWCIMNAKHQADLHHTTDIYSPADAIIINYTVLIFICQFIQCHVAVTPSMCCYCIRSLHADFEKRSKSKNCHYLRNKHFRIANRVDLNLGELFRISFIQFSMYATTDRLQKHMHNHSHSLSKQRTRSHKTKINSYKIRSDTSISICYMQELDLCYQSRRLAK